MSDLQAIVIRIPNLYPIVVKCYSLMRRRRNSKSDLLFFISCWHCKNFSVFHTKIHFSLILGQPTFPIPPVDWFQWKKLDEKTHLEQKVCATYESWLT